MAYESLVAASFSTLKDSIAFAHFERTATEAVTLSTQGLLFQHRVQQDFWQISGHQTAKSFLAQSSLVVEREGWERLCYSDTLWVAQICWYAAAFKYSLLILQTRQSLDELTGRRSEGRQLLMNRTSGTDCQLK